MSPSDGRRGALPFRPHGGRCQPRQATPQTTSSTHTSFYVHFVRSFGGGAEPRRALLLSSRHGVPVPHTAPDRAGRPGGPHRLRTGRGPCPVGRCEAPGGRRPRCSGAAGRVGRSRRGECRRGCRNGGRAGCLCGAGGVDASGLRELEAARLLRPGSGGPRRSAFRRPPGRSAGGFGELGRRRRRRRLRWQLRLSGSDAGPCSRCRLCGRHAHADQTGCDAVGCACGAARRLGVGALGRCGGAPDARRLAGGGTSRDLRIPRTSGLRVRLRT